ncbi:DUF2795 domain-containing protein [Streptomyces sp. SBT349]|uniref:DUF2795 domain-containing protein n=1 Tax=Streptomyces sp. SBT349 TaxID=1580539 RepID=UPI002D21A17C|nr:DUF2795 domain-containing protein [Streptomyces sp. SBT349]
MPRMAPAPAGYPAGVNGRRGNERERHREDTMGKPSPIEVQKALKGAPYPSDKSTLVQTAKENGADQGMVDRISKLDADTFDGPNDVQKAIFR